MVHAMVAAQSIPRATITGVVTDVDTGRPLADVNVFIANTTWGAVTDTDGVYTLERIPYGTYELVASRMGYAYGALRVKLAEAGHYNLALTPTVIELDDGRGFLRTAQRVEKAPEAIRRSVSGHVKKCQKDQAA